MKNSEAFRAIVTAGLVVGVLDISSAFVIWWQRGVGARRGLQGIAGWIAGSELVRRRLGNGWPRPGAPFFRCVCGRIGFLPGQSEDRISGETSCCVWCVVRDRRLHCDVLVRVANGVSNVSTPAVERVARRCHSYFVDRLAVRIDCAPVLSTSVAGIMKASS